MYIHIEECSVEDTGSLHLFQLVPQKMPTCVHQVCFLDVSLHVWECSLAIFIFRYNHKYRVLKSS